MIATHDTFLNVMKREVGRSKIIGRLYTDIMHNSNFQTSEEMVLLDI
jgi:hypothetical protein